MIRPGVRYEIYAKEWILILLSTSTYLSSPTYTLQIMKVCNNALADICFGVLNTSSVFLYSVSQYQELKISSLIRPSSLLRRVAL